MTTSVLTTEEAAAKAGAELLDMTAVEMPHLVAADWYHHIDITAPGAFRMDETHLCVLGHLMPERDFMEACEALRLVEREQFVAAGFAIAAGGSYAALTAAWVNEILDRRAVVWSVSPEETPAI